MIVGLGVDLVGIARIRSVLNRQGERFWQRVCSPEERAYCLAAADPAERLAGRWAIKEATMKALGTGWAQGVSFTDIIFLPTPTGAPALALTGQALARAKLLGANRWLATLSHSDGMAVAVALLEG